MSHGRSGVHVRGDIAITVRDKNGAVVQSIDIRNMVVGTGVAAIPRLLGQLTTAAETAADLKLNALAVGTGTDAPSSLDTGLVAEITGSRSLLADTNVSYPSAGLLRVDLRLPDSVSGSSAEYKITEAGLFLANGDLFARQVHAPITTAPGIQMDYAWTLTFSV